MNYNWQNYDDVREFIKDGDVYFTNSRCVTSSVIDLVTHSHIAHTGSFVWVEKRLFIIESMQGRGVRMMLASRRFLLEKVIVLHSPAFNRQLAFDYLGNDYNLLGAILSPFVALNTHKIYCAELVRDCMDLTNQQILKDDFYYEYFFDRDVYPVDIYNYLLTLPCNKYM